MRKLLSLLTSFVLAASLIPSAAFADEPRGAQGRAGGSPTLSLEFSRFDPNAASGPAYVFTVRASEVLANPVTIAYATFRGTTDEAWFVPVRSAVTLEAGQQTAEIGITACEPDEASLDRYVHAAADGAEPDKYFGVNLLASSAGTIDPDHRAAITGPDILPAKASSVDTTGLLSSDGTGDFLQARFAADNGVVRDLEGLLDFGLYSYDKDTGTYRWRLSGSPVVRSMAVDIRRLGADQIEAGNGQKLDRYFFAAAVFAMRTPSITA